MKKNQLRNTSNVWNWATIPSQMEEYQKEDVRHAFLKGLRSREAHRLLKLNPGTIDYTSLAMTAADLEASLQDLERGNERQ